MVHYLNMYFLGLALALMVASPYSCSSRSLSREEDQARRDQREKLSLRLELGEPLEELRTEGGSIRVWRHESIEDVRVGAAEVELEEDGLLLPNYATAPKIAYVLQGDMFISTR